jgi:hypothetical protein
MRLASYVPIVSRNQATERELSDRLAYVRSEGAGTDRSGEEKNEVALPTGFEPVLQP